MLSVGLSATAGLGLQLTPLILGQTQSALLSVRIERLETSRHPTLKKPSGIVLLADLTEVLLAARAVRSDRVLKAGGIIQILVFVEKVCSLCGLLDAVEQGLRDAVDQSIVLRLVPVDRKQAQYQRTLRGF